MGKETRRDLTNIIVVLTSAICCAGLLSIVFLYYYGPSGRYVAAHTLLDPAIIQQINEQDKQTKSKQNVHFIFDGVYFSYFDQRSGRIQQQKVSAENYHAFYTLIAKEKSLETVTDTIQKLFSTSTPTILTLTMQTKEPILNKSQNQIFQVVQFIPEDYFRVQLHGEGDQDEWAYFYQPHIYQEIMRLFTQSTNL